MTGLALVPSGEHAPLDTHAWEQAVLGSLLLNHAASLAVCRGVKLHPAHFSADAHRVLYRAFEVMADEGTTADPQSLVIFLQVHDALQRAGGLEQISDLLSAVPTHTNVGYYAEMLVRAAKGPAEMVAQGEQESQVGEALRFLQLGADDFVRWPLAPLEQALGGIAPGTMHVFVAHTGTGKTSLCETLKKHWLMAGLRVYGAGLELAPYQLRAQLACRFLGLDHGDLFKGRLQKRPDWPAVREQLHTEIKRQRSDPFFARLRLAPFERLSMQTAADICTRAAEFSADVVMIDHLDHLDSSARGGNDRAESMAALQVIEALTKSYGLRTIMTSQTNREGKSANRLRDHYPITSEMVRYGDHKINASTTFCGLRRPLKAGIEKTEMAAARANYEKVREILAPNTMAVNVMKDRNGDSVGEDIRLGFFRGEVFDDPGLTHGVRTHQKSYA